MVLLIIMLGIAVSMVRLVIGIMIATEIIVKFVVMGMITNLMLIAIVLELELVWWQLIQQHIIDQQHLLNNLKDNSHRHHSSSS